ncbi:MAG: ABC transporter ATP-binding protein, partial [Planctomycetota bacterium]
MRGYTGLAAAVTDLCGPRRIFEHDVHESSKQAFRRFRAEWRRGALRPSADADRQDASTRRRAPWREYLHWLRPFRWAIVTIYVLAMVSALLSLALPLATKHIVDAVIPARDLAQLHLLGLALVGVILVQQTFDFIRNWRTAVLNARFLFRLRQRLYNHLLRLPLHKLSVLKTGGITSRLSGDVDSITGLIQMGIITPAVATSKVLLTIAILVLMNWRMSIAATLLLPIIIVLNLTYIRRVRPIYRSMRKDRGEIDGRVVETFGGIRVVRAFRRERTEALQYARRHHTVIRKKRWAQFMEFFVWSGWGFLIPFAALVTIWYGGALVIADQLTLGGIMAFQMYLMMLLAPVSAIIRSYGEMQQGLAAMERVHELLAEKVEKPDRPGATAAPRNVERIEFDHVSFAYDQG